MSQRLFGAEFFLQAMRLTLATLFSFFYSGISPHFDNSSALV